MSVFLTLKGNFDNTHAQEHDPITLARTDVGTIGVKLLCNCDSGESLSWALVTEYRATEMPLLSLVKELKTRSTIKLFWFSLN